MDIHAELTSVERSSRQMAQDRDLAAHTRSQESVSEALDRLDLQRLGRAPILQRQFGFLAMLGFSCTTLQTWVYVIINYYEFIVSPGDPKFLIFGFLFIWIGLTSVYVCISEMISIAPVSGAHYFWVSILAPKSAQKFLSFLTAWLLLWNWCCFNAQGLFWCASTSLRIARLIHPQYHAKDWQVVLLAILLGFVAFLINSQPRRVLARFLGVTFVIQLLLFIAVLITICSLSKFGRLTEAFEGNVTASMPTPGISFLNITAVMISRYLSLATGDAVVHMAEEVSRASMVIPQAVVSAVLIEGLFGFTFTCVLAFAIGSFAEQIPDWIDWLDMLDAMIHTKPVYITFAIGIVTVYYAASVMSLAASSRLLWALAHDHGVPGWRLLRQVQAPKNVPVRCLGMMTLAGVLLCLTFTAPYWIWYILSLFAFYPIFCLTLALLLWRRMTNQIATNSAHSSTDEYHNCPAQQLVWGPFRVRGWIGDINNAFALAFLVVCASFGCLPDGFPVTLDVFNWDPVVFGCLLVVVTAIYQTIGRRSYTGPIDDFEQRGQHE